MLPGPVFNLELLTTARRPRYYVIRFAYGMILLFFIWSSDPRRYGFYQGELSIQQLAVIGTALFSTFLIVQSIAVLLLTPAMVAGVIADEKRRKTLHYLLASRLSSSEIVLGKLGARLLHVGVFLLIGLPIVSLLSLFGGVDPMVIPLSYAVTFTTAFFLAALAILVSTFTRRPREAISLTYLLEVVWLFVPGIVALVLPQSGPFWLRLYGWIEPVNDWLLASSPFSLITSAAAMNRAGVTSALAFFAWMSGLQMAYGILFVVIALVRLRPIAQREGEGGGGSRWLSKMRRGRRLLPRPECGDDAMLWKELYVSRTALATKVLVALVGFVVLVGLGYGTWWLAGPAFQELMIFGYGSVGSDSSRNDFNGYLRTVCTMLYVLWMLAVASAASAGISSEREEDTWTSLITTPLSGREILRAKMFGSVWGSRWIGVILILLWSTGLLAGSVHPFGLFAVVVETAVYVAFVAALGNFLSLCSKTSARALVTTVLILIVLNGAYLMCCIAMPAHSVVVAAGVTPMVEAISLATFGDVRRLFTEMGFGGPDEAGEIVLTGFVSVVFYAGAAWALVEGAVGAFDERADRPRRKGARPFAGEIVYEDEVAPKEETPAVEEQDG